MSTLKDRPPMGFMLPGSSLPWILMRDFLPLPSLIGACYLAVRFVQIFLPPTLAFLFPFALLVGPWIPSILAHYGYASNPYLDPNLVIPGRSFAKLADDADGPREFAVLKIAAAGDLSLELSRMSRNRLITWLYFRSVEDVHRFAHEKLHSLYAKEYQGTQPGMIESEVYHELFSVKAGGFDAIYVNVAQPHGMGRIHEREMVDGAPTGPWKSILRPIGAGSETSAERLAL